MKHSTLKWLIMSLMLCVGVGAWATEGDVLSQGFESTGTPANWTTGGQTSQRTTTGKYSGSASWQIGSNGGNTGSIQTPALSSLSGNATLKFYARSKNNVEGTLTISISNTGNTALIDGASSIIKKVKSVSDSWIEITVEITGGTSDTKITFSKESSSGSTYIYIDDITITATSSKTPCVDVSTMTIDPDAIDIKTDKSGTFSATATKNDASATYSYSTTALSGLSVESDGRYTATAAGTYSVKVTATPSDTENYSEATKSFDITVSDTRDACGLSFASAAYNAYLGFAFDSPALVNPNSLTVSYTSTVPAIATVDADGTVTVLQEGSTVIKATTEGNDDYKGGEVSYTLTVSDPNKETFDFASPGTYGFDVPGKSDGTDVGSNTIDGDVVTLSFTDGGTATRFWNSSGTITLRIYASSPGGSMTASVPDGYVITKIVYTGSGGFSVEGSAVSTSTKTWTGKQKSVKFDCTANATLSGLAVYYAPAATVGSALYATYVTPTAVDFGDEVEAFVVSAAGDNATLQAVTEAPANTPVIIRATSADTYTFARIASASSVGTNLLKIASEDMNGNGTNLYILANDTSHGVGFYLLSTEGTKLAAGKVYLEVPAASAKAFIGFFNNESSAVEGIAVETQVSGRIYNLAGQQLKSLQKGINIVNGKKFFVK